ncbi:MAG: efflux RND transporter permease subunit, partial [Gemmatimonadota bacterium]
SLPASVKVAVMYDRSVTIRQSVSDVKFTMYLTLGLVVLVIFLFLRNIPATIIPSLALPMSLVGTFAVMALLGYSLDNLSLMALTLSVGFVVDDAIVMLENIVRHMEMGKPAMEAALEGSAEIGFTIVSMTISLVAVFIPVLFLGGLIGRLFHEFAVTIGAAILVSALVSLTLTPMLCSRFLKSGHEQHGRFYQASERFYERVLHGYQRSLGWIMDRRGLALAISGVLLLVTGWLAVAVPKGFIPSEDQDQLRATIEAAEGSSFDAMKRYIIEINQIIGADSNIAGFMTATGGGGRSANQARAIMHLTPAATRSLDADAVGRELSTKLRQIPGINTFVQNPPVINIGGRQTKSLYQYTLQGSDIDQLYATSQALEARLRKLPELRNVTTDLLIKNPEIHIAIDRDRAAAFGVSPSVIEDALYQAYGAGQASTIYTATNQYWVIMELLPQYQRDLSAMSLLSVRAANGTLVPLTALARVTEGLGPLAVNHSGQQPSVTLSFDPAPGVAVGDAVAAVNKESANQLPAGILASFSGTAQA